MERDLRVIRKKRAERDRARDRALGIPSPISPAKEGKDISQQSNDGSVGNATAVQDTAQNPISQGEDMLLARDHGESSALSLPENLQGKVNEGEVIGTGQGMPQDSENSAGLAITIPPDSTTSAQSQPNNVEKQPETAPSVPETSLDIPDAADLDFESMFTDTDLVNGDDAMNFDDLSFSMDTNVMNQDILNNTALQNTTLGDADITNLPSTSNEDINSLLPGLENYVNADTTDFSNIGMPSTSTQPENTQGAAVAATTTGMPPASSNPAEPAPADTSFDDLFGMDFDMNAAGGDEMGDGTLGDFEDFNWD